MKLVGSDIPFKDSDPFDYDENDFKKIIAAVSWCGNFKCDCKFIVLILFNM